MRKNILFLIMLMVPTVSWMMEQPETLEKEAPVDAQPCPLNDLDYELKHYIASYICNNSDKTPSLKKYKPIIIAGHISKIWYQIMQTFSLFSDNNHREILCAIPTSLELMAMDKKLKETSKVCSCPPFFTKEFKEKISIAAHALQEFTTYFNKQLEKDSKTKDKGIAVRKDVHGIFQKLEALLDTNINPNICINHNGEIMTFRIDVLNINNCRFVRNQYSKCVCFIEINHPCECYSHLFYSNFSTDDFNNFLKKLLNNNVIITKNFFGYKIKDTPLITFDLHASSILEFADQINDQELKQLAIAHGAIELENAVHPPMPAGFTGGSWLWECYTNQGH